MRFSLLEEKHTNVASEKNANERNCSKEMTTSENFVFPLVYGNNINKLQAYNTGAYQ